jgi:hypothetical protein
MGCSGSKADVKAHTADLRGMVHKTKTEEVRRSDYDFLVTHYSCTEDSMLKHRAERVWTVQAGVSGAPTEIRVHVDKKVSRQNVQIKCKQEGAEEKTLFPNKDSVSQEKFLREDFCHQWPYRGDAFVTLNEPGRYEVRPAHTADEWYHATIHKQRQDGLFDVTVRLPATNFAYSTIQSVLGVDPDVLGSWRNVDILGVSHENIRDSISRRPLHVSCQNLFLNVPQSDPLASALNVDGGISVLTKLGRPTPKPSEKGNVVEFDNTDNPKFVKANVGHNTLLYFLSGEARSVKSNASTYHREWTIQLGPFAEHNIRLDWTRMPKKSVTLTIDGEPLVDADTKQFFCESDVWDCNFRFVGEKMMNFTVFEMNKDGYQLDTKGVAHKTVPYTHSCSARFDFGAGGARLRVDDMDVSSLPSQRSPQTDVELEPLHVDVLHGTYGITIPYKVNVAAPVGLESLFAPLAKAFGAGGESSKTTSGGPAGGDSSETTSAGPAGGDSSVSTDDDREHTEL